MKVADDDPNTLVLHQSDVKTFLTCPDQFRVVNHIEPGGLFDKTNDEHRVETDAATVGTAAHAVFEHEIEEGPFQSLKELVAYGEQMYVELVTGYDQGGYEFRQETFTDLKRALKALERVVTQWWNSQLRVDLLQQRAEAPNSLMVEWNFEVPFINNRDGMYENIRLAGMADILDTYNHRVLDYKTSSQEYKRWEKQRWDPQSTVYTYAAAALGHIDPHPKGYQFDFAVFQHRKPVHEEPQIVTVWRTADQWGWLVQVVSNMVNMIESDLKEWPLTDNHVLCSPKWCPIWSSCKGMWVGEEWS